MLIVRKKSFFLTYCLGGFQKREQSLKMYKGTESGE